MALGTALTVSVVLTGLSRLVGERIGFVDRPDSDLKTHQGAPVPLGGVGVLGGLHAGLAALGVWDLGLVVGTVAVFTLGLVDDRIGLTPGTRIIGVSLSGLALAFLSDSADGLWVGMAAIVCVLALVNSVNLLDGIDGLAGAVTSVAAVGVAWFGSALEVESGWVPLLLAGAIAGFMFFNLPPARVFLGDNGAYVIGVTLAWAVVHNSTDWISGLVAFGLIGVPLMDLGATVFRRMQKGRPLFAGDRDHLYDRLSRRYRGPYAVVLVYSAVQAAWIGYVLLLWSVVGGVAALIGVVALAVVISLIASYAPALDVAIE